MSQDPVFTLFYLAYSDQTLVSRINNSIMGFAVRLTLTRSQKHIIQRKMYTTLFPHIPILQVKLRLSVFTM